MLTTIKIVSFFQILLNRRFVFRSAVFLFCGCVVAASNAQQESAKADQIESLQQKFDELQIEFRNVVFEVQKAGVTYLNEPTIDQADPYLKKFDEFTAKGNEILDRWVAVGKSLFNAKLAADKEIDDDLMYFVTKIMARNFNRDEFEAAYQLAERLVDLNPENLFAEIYRARAGLLTNRFGKKITYTLERNKEQLGQEDFLSHVEAMMVGSVYFLKAEFEKEQEIRKRESDADDLPRVKFVTNKGEFIIELFENEAPETVGNFISLIESGHYNGLVFHTVIHHTAAETGALDEDLKPRLVDYTIYDEHLKPNARKIFAGSVVMNNGGENLANTRFFVSLGSLVQLNGTQTVFGRIISGMDSVYKLNKTFEIVEGTQRPIDDVVPDKIVSATVLRKRNHEYKPRKVSRK